MKVRFELTPRLAELAGFREVSLDLPDPASLDDALRAFRETLHRAAEERGLVSELLTDGNLHPSILVVVNGRAQARRDSVPLTGGEVIQLLLPVAGG